MKRHIKINSGFIDVYYCKDFISLRDSNEDRFFYLNYQINIAI